MKIALITRSTLYTVPGGDTVQIAQTARELAELGINADICLSDQSINYDEYDLLHFFNLIRPADILYHSQKAKKPFVVSTILVDYSEYDKYHRKGIGKMISYFSGDGIEYLKTIARWLMRKDHLSSLSYTWKGQRNSIIQILGATAMILPNSESEYNRIRSHYPCTAEYVVVPNGIDPLKFKYDKAVIKDENLVICAARIEGIKNQLNLIKALNNTRFRLLIIGASAPNQGDYYRECRDIAADNIRFIDRMPQDELVNHYQQAKVHVLPSWFETTGLSSIEAAAMGCNIVITDKGDTREYFGDDAFYCEPSSPQRILMAVEQASASPFNENLFKKIHQSYTWKQAAIQTLKAYHLAATA
jgi:glycosyltransferase involved in cell wall biosynthesis